MAVGRRDRRPADAAPEIVLDISRLVSRIRHAAPTGVDRVELAYARELIRRVPERLSFAVVHPSGFYGRLPDRAARAFLDRTEAAWTGALVLPERGLRGSLALARTLWAMRPRPIPPARGPRILIQSSPHHLHRERLVRNILKSERARLICLLHDLIPIEFPEYARPGGDDTHRARIGTIARLASAAVSNSAATREAFLPYLAQAGRTMPVAVAHLGLDAAGTIPEAADEPPYFVCVGTIEPRKNHLLLLNIWRRLVETLGPAQTPRLKIVGRRGWENEQVVDMLERCPALAGCVDEMGSITDAQVHAIVAHARALLLPSFAEGYGMPIPEALSSGVPVLCSDIPALREAGGDVPEYLDPLDGPAWIAAVREYARPGSVRRAAQLARIPGWQAPTWRQHIDTVLELAEALA